MTDNKYDYKYFIKKLIKYRNQPQSTLLKKIIIEKFDKINNSTFCVKNFFILHYIHFLLTKLILSDLLYLFFSIYSVFLLHVTGIPYIKFIVKTVISYKRKVISQ